jgi:hypothetical protein
MSRSLVNARGVVCRLVMLSLLWSDRYCVVSGGRMGLSIMYGNYVHTCRQAVFLCSFQGLQTEPSTVNAT